MFYLKRNLHLGRIPDVVFKQARRRSMRLSAVYLTSAKSSEKGMSCRFVKACALSREDKLFGEPRTHHFTAIRLLEVDENSTRDLIQNAGSPLRNA